MRDQNGDGDLVGSLGGGSPGARVGVGWLSRWGRLEDQGEEREGAGGVSAVSGTVGGIFPSGI